MKYYIYTFGCQMNVRDSERLEGFLRGEGFQPALSEEEADIVFINSCTVREKPEHKALSLLGRFQKLKKKNKNLIIGICGCLAQQYQEKLLSLFPELDLVVGTHSVGRICELIKDAREGRRVLSVGFESKEMVFLNPEIDVRDGVSAFVSIMEGCDNYCAFCVVPYVRGRELSRPMEDIKGEVSRLAQRGVKEIILLGQNVNSYKDSGTDFPGLLKELSKVEGIERIRFTTSHPKDLSMKLIEVMAECDKVMEHIHLPLQSGSSRVLERMNRGYTREHYLALISALRANIPDVGLSTDLLVGFPGETEDDFKETLEVVEQVEFDEAFTFRFTKRPLTRASEMDGQLPEEIKLERLYRLIELQDKITLRKNEMKVGRVEEVLVEGRSKTDPGKFTGRARTNHLVHFSPEKNSSLEGEILKIKIKRALRHSLEGELFEQGLRISDYREEQCLLR